MKYLTNLFKRTDGGVSMSGILLMAIAMVFISVGFIFLPITTDAAQSLLDYQYTSNASITDATFTGYTSMVGITPLLVLLGFLTAGVISGMMGLKVIKGGATASANPGSLIMLGLSIVFIGVALIVEPIMLDGAASVLHGDGGGISSTFTGYQSIVQMSPLLVHLGFLAGSVLAGFFGIKKLGGSTSD